VTIKLNNFKHFTLKCIQRALPSLLFYDGQIGNAEIERKRDLVKTSTQKEGVFRQKTASR